jgi:SAM-dependent methyltransferase
VLLNAISTQNATAREFERAKAEFDARLDDHEARLPAFVARLDDHEARLTTLGETLTYVDSRNEFIRREVMYEARYGARSKGVLPMEARDVNLAKLSNGGPLRLNLGSGHVPREGFVNVDARDIDGVDVVADVRQLPFKPGTVEEIYAAHLVEHFPIEELRRVLLPHWFGLLRPGGRLVVVTPDAETMITEAANGLIPFEDLQRVIFGDQEYDGDFHFAMLTPDSFSGLLSRCGFANIEVIERARRNGLAYEFEITGERPDNQEALGAASE